jgi:hypothetical protein
MKVKIVIQTMEPGSDNESWDTRNSEVWSGELAILKEGVYVAKVSLIGEGEPQPICDIPFSLGVGHYRWIPPDNYIEMIGGWHVQDTGKDDLHAMGILSRLL